MIFCFVKVKVISKLLFECPKITYFWNAAFDCGGQVYKNPKIKFFQPQCSNRKKLLNCKRFYETNNFRSSIDRVGSL